MNHTVTVGSDIFFFPMGKRLNDSNHCEILRMIANFKNSMIDITQKLLLLDFPFNKNNLFCLYIT
ncbi:unnamed protein product [Brugia timori]|uniref:Uncharacterized protein n=1 Tax=Brugia timori TaxID=42155 RepID=A0A0R3QWM0_9BILA|nr:unnamed protein product [Brugia timori]